MEKLTIDTEFYNLTVPYNKENQEIFERSILYEGCLEPIIVWEGMIIDGHKRYLFCSNEEIEYEVRDIHFQSREKAIAWVCRKRIKNLLPGTPAYKYLFGKWINSLKPAYRELIEKRMIDCPRSSDGRIRIAKVIADDLGLSYSSVANNSVYANNVDRMIRNDPDIFRAMMEQKIKLTVEEVRALSHGDAKTRSIIKSRLRFEEEPQPRRGRPKKKTSEDGEVRLSTRIKEMPPFDPDMEIRGLALTIPTWMAAIARAEEKTDLGLTTDLARKHLADSLIRLEKQIQQTLEAVLCMEMES